jgi:multidrug efflux pump
VAFTGSGGGTTTNTGRVFISLKPLEERQVSADQVINRLRHQLATVPGASLFLQSAQDLRVGGRSGNAQYQYTIQSDNLDDLTRWGPTLLQQMRKLPSLVDVNSDQQNSGLQAAPVYDRQTASGLGLTPQTIDDTLYDAFRQRQVSTMYKQLNQYPVVVAVEPRFWQSP